MRPVIAHFIDKKMCLTCRKPIGSIQSSQGVSHNGIDITLSCHGATQHERIDGPLVAAGNIDDIVKVCLGIIAFPRRVATYHRPTIRELLEARPAR